MSGCGYFATPTQAAASPDGDMIVAGFSFGDIFLYSSNPPFEHFAGFHDSVGQLAFSNDALRLAGSSVAAWTFSVYDLGTRHKLIYRQPPLWRGFLPFGRSARVVTALNFGGKERAWFWLALTMA